MQLQFVFLFALASASLCNFANAAASQVTAEANSARPEPIVARLFYQDRTANALRWLDLCSGKIPGFEASRDVAGFPELDAERQGLVQMKEAGGFLLVGVRDDDEGAFGSGWILIDEGVTEEPHGDHSHWRYRAPPSVREARIDTEQGNPAHLYEYDGVFYLANDKKDGYTRLDPATVPKQGDVPFAFHRGGGGHITLAVANGAGYGTWIDGGGPNAGRVDVTLVRPEGNSDIAATFDLPSGVIHGATAAANKVFFAPADGICWVDATGPSASIEPRHLSLGNDSESDKPRRTGAFAVHRDRVLFVTGRGDDASLGLLDARQAEPKLITVKLPGPAGTRPVTPACVRTSRGKQHAFVFHDAFSTEEGEEAEPVTETVTILDLDPNGDGDFADTKIVKTLNVGRSAVSGHNGHHSIAFDADGRRAFIANPGDGTITAVWLANLEPWGTIEVGGQPEAVIATGGRETRD